MMGLRGMVIDVTERTIAVLERVEEAARGVVDGQPTDDMAAVVVRVPPQ